MGSLRVDIGVAWMLMFTVDMAVLIVHGCMDKFPGACHSFSSSFLRKCQHDVMKVVGKFYAQRSPQSSTVCGLVSTLSALLTSPPKPWRSASPNALYFSHLPYKICKMPGGLSYTAPSGSSSMRLLRNAYLALNGGACGSPKRGHSPTHQGAAPLRSEKQYRSALIAFRIYPAFDFHSHRGDQIEMGECPPSERPASVVSKLRTGLAFLSPMSHPFPDWL